MHALNIGGEADALAVVGGLHIVAINLALQFSDFLVVACSEELYSLVSWPRIEACSAACGLDGSGTYFPPVICACRPRGLRR